MVASIQEFDARDWVKVRNSLDGEQAVLIWTGAIYSFIPGEKKQKLFKIVGMSVSRCIACGENAWDFTSRELTYYLDPETGEILHQWQNPWTDEVLTVMHVANNPVQGHFKGKFPAKVDGDITTFAFDLFSHYPNPLAEDKRFAEYSPNPTYQAIELFKLTVPTQELREPDRVSVSNVILAWDRIGPWVPWMKMGDKAGQLIYSATGSKVNNFADWPQVLHDEVSHRIPLFKEAPKAYLEDREDVTSWIYFKQNFDAYLAGERFPLPVSEE